MLFVLVMETLNHLLRWVDQRGLLLQVPGLNGTRASLFADDLVFFVTPDVPSLLAVKAALNIFGLASGLFANLEKSVATALNCSEQQMAVVIDTLSCRAEDFPRATDGGGD